MTNEEKIMRDAYDSLVCFINRRAIPPQEEQRLREIIDRMKAAAREEGRREGAAKIEALENRVKELEEIKDKYYSLLGI